MPCERQMANWKLKSFVRTFSAFLTPNVILSCAVTNVWTKNFRTSLLFETQIHRKVFSLISVVWPQWNVYPRLACKSDVFRFGNSKPARSGTEWEVEGWKILAGLSLSPWKQWLGIKCSLTHPLQLSAFFRVCRCFCWHRLNKKTGKDESEGRRSEQWHDKEWKDDIPNTYTISHSFPPPDLVIILSLPRPRLCRAPLRLISSFKKCFQLVRDVF